MFWISRNQVTTGKSTIRNQTHSDSKPTKAAATAGQQKENLALLFYIWIYQISSTISIFCKYCQPNDGTNLDWICITKRNTVSRNLSAINILKEGQLQVRWKKTMTGRQVNFHEKKLPVYKISRLQQAWLERLCNKWSLVRLAEEKPTIYAVIPWFIFLSFSAKFKHNAFKGYRMNSNTHRLLFWPPYIRRHMLQFFYGYDVLTIMHHWFHFLKVLITP